MEIFEGKFKPVSESSEEPDEKIEYIKQNQEKIARDLIEAADEKIGSGQSANVYVDPEYPDLCYKQIKRGKNVNTIEVEAGFLETVRSIESDVGVPLPTMTISFDYEKEGERLHCNAMAMERINGMTLEEIADNRKFPKGAEPKNKEDLKNLRDSFQKIKAFVDEMNSELGIYHTDLKERNIMLDENKKWWIIDFGEAKKVYFEDETQNLDSQDLKRTWNEFSLVATGYIESLQNS